MDTQAIPAPRPRESVSGYLRTRCEADSEGVSRLTLKEFKSPIHISKPYWDGSSLLLNLMCPTAGMLGGDRVQLDVEVRSGAALALSNPSSLRIHKMDADDTARWSQSFSVGADAVLESNPEWLILQARSCFEQRTAIDVDADGELFFIEAIAPGRVAHGEAFQFRSFRNRLALRYDGALSVLEKHDIRPEKRTHSAWHSADLPLPFYVSIHLVSRRLSDDSSIWSLASELQSDELRIGSSRLARGPCWNIKLLTDDPPQARRAIASLRESFYSAIGRIPPKLRRQ